MNSDSSGSVPRIPRVRSVRKQCLLIQSKTAVGPLDVLVEQAIPPAHRWEAKYARGHIRFAGIDADERAAAKPGDAFTGDAHGGNGLAGSAFDDRPAVHPKAIRATRPCCDAGRRPARNPSPSR